MTAAHVLRDAVPEIEAGTFFGQKLDRNLFVLVVLEDKKSKEIELVYARVGHTVVSNDFDLAVFEVEYPSIDPTRFSSRCEYGSN